ncbi:MAG: MFS transporter [Saprospiraceae bacterium]
MLARAFTHWRDSFRGIPHNVWLLSLVSLVNRCGGMVIAFMTLYLTQKLDYGIREAGYVMSCFGVGAIAGAYAGGWLTDKVGYYRVQFWSLAANGLILISLLTVRDFWAMCLTVGVWSFISDVFRPANVVAIIRNTKPENYTRSFSLMRMSYNLGWTVAPALGGIIVYTFGWEWLFWIDGLTCLAAALLLRLTLRERQVAAPEAKPDTGEGVENQQDVHPLRDVQYLKFLGLTMLGAIAFMQILWTVPVFFKEVYGWHEGKIGWVSAINGALVVLIEMPLIFQIEGKRDRLTWVRLGLILYGVSHFAFTLFAPGWGMAAALIYMVAISFGEIFVMPFSNSWVSARAGDRKQGQYMAMYTMSYSISNVLAPMLGTQVIAAWGYNALWYVVTGLALVAWVGMGQFQRQKNDVAAATA